MPRRVRPRAQSSNDVEPAGGVAAADHRADRGADDDVRLDAVREQRADHADMGKAARRAAAERKPDGRALDARGVVGRRFGAAVAVPSAALTFEHQAFSVAGDDRARRSANKAIAPVW